MDTYTSTDSLKLGDSRDVTYLPNEGPLQKYTGKHSQLIVQKALDDGLPESTNSIYLIFPSEDINETDVSDITEKC